MALQPRCRAQARWLIVRCLQSRSRLCRPPRRLCRPPPGRAAARSHRAELASTVGAQPAVPLRPCRQSPKGWRHWELPQARLLLWVCEPRWFSASPPQEAGPSQPAPAHQTEPTGGGGGKNPRPRSGCAARPSIDETMDKGDNQPQRTRSATKRGGAETTCLL